MARTRPPPRCWRSSTRSGSLSRCCWAPGSRRRPAPRAGSAPNAAGRGARRQPGRGRGRGPLATAYPDVVLGLVVGQRDAGRLVGSPGGAGGAGRLAARGAPGHLPAGGHRRRLRLLAQAGERRRSPARSTSSSSTPTPCGTASRSTEALAFTQEKYAAVGRRHPGLPVVLGEAGWATRKHTEGDQGKLIKGQPGEPEQKVFFDQFTRLGGARPHHQHLVRGLRRELEGWPPPRRGGEALGALARRPDAQGRGGAGALSQQWAECPGARPMASLNPGGRQCTPLPGVACARGLTLRRVSGPPRAAAGASRAPGARSRRTASGPAAPAARHRAVAGLGPD